jgi:hypothetical protein
MDDISDPNAYPESGISFAFSKECISDSELYGRFFEFECVHSDGGDCSLGVIDYSTFEMPDGTFLYKFYWGF